jgi:hypothetical protein
LSAFSKTTKAPLTSNALMISKTLRLLLAEFMSLCAKQNKNFL